MVTGAFSVYMHRYKQADIKKELAGVAFRDVSFIYRTSRLAEVVNRHLSFMLSGKQLKGMGARNVTPSRTPCFRVSSRNINLGAVVSTHTVFIFVRLSTNLTYNC